MKVSHISANDLLKAWEHGRAKPPFKRALVMLDVAVPECTVEELARLTIGQRDAMLLELRELEFGSKFSALANCPACSETVEMSFAANDVRVHKAPPNSIAVKSGSYAARFRLPNSADLLALESTGQITRDAMLARCALETKKRGTPCTFNDLPDRLKESAALKLGEVDPQADIQLTLDCPSCLHHWASPFDIVSFLWLEIERRAKGLLREVHTLASAYGWSENDILAMSPQRRQSYLEMLMK